MLEIGPPPHDGLVMSTLVATQEQSMKLELENKNRILGGPRQHRTHRVFELADRFDCIPLGISQAAAFVNKNSVSTADYLERVSVSSDEILAELATRGPAT
jgi:hypothetical protein